MFLLSSIGWFILNTIKFLVWVLIAFLFGLWWNQSNFLYMPNMEGRDKNKRMIKYNPEGLQSPSDMGIPFEEHYIKTKDEEIIHSWLLLRPDSQTRPIIIFFHGNAGNIGFRLPNAKLLYSYLHANVLLVEYRGYGNSSGIPSETGLLYDAEASLAFVKNNPKLDGNNIYIFGRSLGGAVALNLTYCNMNDVKGLIIENTFTCIDEMAIILAKRMNIRTAHRVIKVFLFVFLTNRWPNIHYVSEITTPIMFISGLADELIPPSHMHELHSNANQSKLKKFYGVAGGEHNDTYVKGGKNYFQEIHSFMQESSSLVT